MFTHTFDPIGFLRTVYGTEPFVMYCQSRSIAFEQGSGTAMKGEGSLRWQAAVKRLPESQQARVELELSQVNEMAHTGALALLLEALPGRGLPADSIPGEAALALWYFLHHPDLFHDVFLQQEIREVGSWRIARARSGIKLDDVGSRTDALAASLQEFFRVREGTGRYCAIEAHRLKTAYCFVAHLSDRLHLFDVFTDDGEHTTQAARLSFPILFAYYPEDGRIFLKARQRAAHKVLDLIQRFGKAVLGISLDERCLRPVYRLDLFKRRFDPLLDAEDMESVRVKALHLAYPERLGRWRVKLETLSGDGQFAILDLLKDHGGGDDLLEQLEVVYAELEVRLRVEGRSKCVVIRLWPVRCSLNQTALGERLQACLRRWGITYAT